MSPRAHDPANEGIARLGPLLLAAATGAALLVIGYLLAFSGYAASDDEGYVLWSLRHFCKGDALYTEVFNQYGPLFHLGYRALHAASGLLPDHELGRWTTLGCWLATSATCGWIAARLGRSLVAGVAGAALTFASLLPTTVEPAHPGGPLTLLVALAAAFGLHALERERPIHFAAIGAAIGAAMGLFKINVGAFFLAALAGWLVLHAPATGHATPRRRILGVGLAAALLFAALTRVHLGEPWTWVLATVFLGAAIPLAIFCAFPGGPVYGPAAWRTAVLAGTAVLVITATATAVLGTSPGWLLKGVLLNPLGHAHAYSYAIPWRPGVLLAALVLPALALALHLRAPPRLRRGGLIALKLAGGIWYLWHVRHVADPVGLYRFNFEFGPTLAVVLILPPDRVIDAAWSRSAAWIAWLLAWQILQGYPVAGSQLAWGSFLFAPLVAGAMAQALGRIPGPRAGLAGRLGRATTLAAAALALGLLGRLAWNDFARGTPLGLPGAEDIRMPAAQAAGLRTVTLNLGAHASLVYSLPGMFSFNLWSGRPTPDGQNVTHWFSLLDAARQTAIANRLVSDHETMLVVDPAHLRLLDEMGRAPGGPLHEAMKTHFVPHARIGRYEIHRHRARDLSPMGVFRRGADNRLLLFALSGTEPAARVRLRAFAPGEPTLAELRPAEPITLAPRHRASRPEPLVFALALAWRDDWPAPAATELLLLNRDGDVIQALSYDALGEIPSP